MKTLNRVTLIGNVANDLELKISKSGKTWTKFAVATNRMYLDKSGEKKSCTDFHSVAAWGSLAELSAKFLAKGLPIFLEGKLVKSSYETENGEKKYVTDIYLDDLNILRFKKDKQGNSQVDMEELKTK